MIIELPDRFEKKQDNGGTIIVKNGILKIRGKYNFGKIMVMLAYEMKGRKKCWYCGNLVAPSKITIDHIYPKDFGGVSITNNLLPACQLCNSMKSNMNNEEFEKWQKIQTKTEKKKYYLEVVELKRIKKYSKEKWFDLPEEWVTEIELEKIKVDDITISRQTDKYYKMWNYSKVCNKLLQPIIISSNYYILDGKKSFSIAMDLKMDKVPVIILENVLVESL